MQYIYEYFVKKKKKYNKFAAFLPCFYAHFCIYLTTLVSILLKNATKKEPFCIVPARWLYSVLIRRKGFKNALAASNDGAEEVRRPNHSADNVVCAGNIGRVDLLNKECCV